MNVSDPNPYDSPEHRLQRAPSKQYAAPRDKWLGILGILGGIALLAVTFYYYQLEGVIWIWGLGGGVGVAIVGTLRLRSYFEDKRYSAILNDESEDS